MTNFTIATRGSDLAVTQCSLVAHRLRDAGLNVTTEIITTHGDTNRKPLRTMGGIGVFAGAIRSALLDGQADIAVHSFKDLPTASIPGLTVAAVPRRVDPRDALVARDNLTLDQLPEGASVGTGSPRRIAQLLHMRPDLTIVDIRGNVPTRIGRVKGMHPSGATARNDLDAVIVAKSGVERLGLNQFITEVFEPDQMLPAAAQGALAVECRTADLERHKELATAMLSLDAPMARIESAAERAVLERLMAGCAAPVGALATAAPSSAGTELDVVLNAVVSSLDGTQRVAAQMSTTLPFSSGRAQADNAASTLGHRVAEMLLEQGAADITDLQATKPPRG